MSCTIDDYSGCSEQQLENLFGQGGAYGYRPALSHAIPFLVIYTISTIVHLVQAFKKPGRRAWMLVFALGGLVEVIGWAGRLWSHFQLFGSGFLIQICTLVIAPTFFSAGL